jgi:hypothetical protein
MKVEDILNHVILGILYIHYGLFSSQVYRGFKIIHYLYRWLQHTKKLSLFFKSSKSNFKCFQKVQNVCKRLNKQKNQNFED